LAEEVRKYHISVGVASALCADVSSRRLDATNRDAFEKAFARIEKICGPACRTMSIPLLLLTHNSTFDISPRLAHNYPA
jgi:hypothetical protein